MYLVGAAEIGAMLRISRQRVQQLVNSPDFPKPLATLAMGKVWLGHEVETWAKANGRRIYS